MERGAKIREKGEENTIGFDHCVRKALTEGTVRFLTDDQALTLQIINNYRDAGQHYMLDISEELLYTTAQVGITLFKTMLKQVFDQNLGNYFPERVLPISTRPPTDIAELYHSEVEAIQALLQPGKRKRTEALARLRPLAIMDDALQGQNHTPSDEQLNKLGKSIRQGKEWHELFPGVASIEITTTGYGTAFEVHITKKEGIPIQIVPEGTPNAGAVAVRRVSELGFYNLNATQLSEKVGLTMPKCLAYVWYLDLRNDPDCYKEFKLGSQIHKRYSPKAIERIQLALTDLSPDEVWSAYNARNKIDLRKRNIERELVHS